MATALEPRTHKRLPASGPKKQSSQYCCTVCNKMVFSTMEELHKHLTTEEHENKWIKAVFINNKTELFSPKNGIDILPEKKTNVTYQKNVIKIELQQGHSFQIKLSIVNEGVENIIFHEVAKLYNIKWITFSDDYGVCAGKKLARIFKGMDYEVTCDIQAQLCGVVHIPIVFKFTNSKGQYFYIVRPLEIEICDDISYDCRSSEPFEPRSRAILPYSDIPKDYEPGIPLKGLKDNLKGNILGLYKFPSKLRIVASKNFEPSKLPQDCQPIAKDLKTLMETGLLETNYSEWFHTVLWIEEMQMDQDIMAYNIEGGALRKVPPEDYSAANCVELQVHGLAEKRPSLLKNDSIFVTLPGKSETAEGKVHYIREKSIYVAFGKKFMNKFIENMKVNVRFTFNRNSIRCSHRAVDMYDKTDVKSMLFPKNTKPTRQAAQNIRLFNQKIGDNIEQLTAVRNIVGGTGHPAPYIVFGPPGTGKTITIVEAIKQIHFAHPKKNILVCAPSNSAADILALRLLEHVSKKDIFRLIAVSRAIVTIPTKIKEISNVYGTDIIYPDEDALNKYNIIVCTLVTSAKLVSGNFARDYFSHVFVDECGQATEAEAIIPLTGLLSSTGHVILAGDPYQLGPIIRSRLCSTNDKYFNKPGLDYSLLERLMSLDMYKNTKDSNVVTKLRNNYRSHSDIIKIPNEFFYEGELVAKGDLSLTNALTNLEYLPTIGFPMIFHSVEGKDKREGKSPSFFNTQEISIVIDYISKLLSCKTPLIRPRDIGIITPYRSQVNKIRGQVEKRFKKENYKELKIGSVEEFQGDERLVIIISTVRASPDYLIHDNKYNLGFLQNAKRFNVAMTRAKALVIVVGFPDLLFVDPYWGRLVEFIQNRGGFLGKTFINLDKCMAEFASAFANLDLNSVCTTTTTLAAEKPWRLEQ